MLVLTKEQLKDVLMTLPSFFPKSMQLDAIIRNKLSGQYDWPGTEIVVDKYPEYSILMFRPVKGSAEYIPWPRTYCVTIFCRDVKEMEKVIRGDDFFDWTQYGSEFFALSRNDVFPLIVKRCEELGSTELPVVNYGIMHLLNPSNLIKSEIPEGFHLGDLTEVHAEQINNEWRYGSPASLPFYHHLLQNKFPSSGLFTTEGRLVAYILYCPDGSMFNGFVQPEYRKKGLYQIVNYDLASKVKAMGQPIPWAYVANWNEPSLNANRKLGAKMVDPAEYSLEWLHFRPTNTQLS